MIVASELSPIDPIVEIRSSTIKMSATSTEPSAQSTFAPLIKILLIKTISCLKNLVHIKEVGRAARSVGGRALFLTDALKVSVELKNLLAVEEEGGAAPNGRRSPVLSPSPQPLCR